MTKASIRLAPKIVENFSQPAKHRIFKGGRGSTKTVGLATMSALKCYQFAEANRQGIFLCSREHLNSLDDSSMESIKEAIRAEAFLNDYFEIGERFIRTKNRRVTYAFAGLRQNLDSIKGKANILCNWTDEAENVSEMAWRKLIPTIRGSDDLENWVSYNPESADSATHKRFVEQKPSRCIVTDINWRDNPWFMKSGLNEERLDDLRLRPDTYDHVWEGGFLTITDAQVFKNKYVVDEFEVKDNWDGAYQGVDFGFSKDPTTAVRCYIHNKTLYISHEAGKVGLELDDTAKFINKIPRFSDYTSRGDSARPESISYLKRHGLPRIESVMKWAGSIEDGISFMKSFEKIVIHPDCEQTAREFRNYSFKVDKRSGDILPDIIDDHNHYIDAIRYALAPLIRFKAKPKSKSKTVIGMF